MAVSIFDENITHDGFEFTPFDDSKTSNVKRAAAETLITSSSGMNTSEIDAFRQGIELTTQAHRFKGFGAKIWAGNVKGYTKIITIGQTLPFTEYENNIAFEELPRFDPVGYIEQGPSYPFPIVFNEGPQQNEETTLQPLTIPNRNGANDVEGNEKAHAIRGNLENGNPDYRKLNGRNSIIEQFIPFDTEEITPKPFLDEGVEYWGQLTGSLLKITGSASTLGLFNLNGNTRDHTSYGNNLGASLPVTFSNGGPSPGTRAYHTSQSYGPVLSSSTGTELQITGEMTLEFLYYPSSSMQADAGIKYLIGHAGLSETSADNILYLYYLQHSTKNLTYWHEYGSGTNITLTAGSVPISFDKWNHLAFTRTTSGGNLTVRMYVNGKLVRTTTVTPPTDGSDGKFVVGAPYDTYSSTGIPDARYSSIRILDYPLTTKEIQQSVTSSLLYPRPAHNINSIKVNGFIYEDEKVIKPYIDRNNYSLVEQLNTNDPELIKIFTSSSSKLNLDEDIRETYDKKSSTAGYSVYGPGTERTGTDSVVYNGWLRGN